MDYYPLAVKRFFSRGCDAETELMIMITKTFNDLFWMLEKPNA